MAIHNAPRPADVTVSIPLRAKPVKPEPGPPMTLGNAAAARVVRVDRVVQGTPHQVEPDPAEMAVP